MQEGDEEEGALDGPLGNATEVSVVAAVCHHHGQTGVAFYEKATNVVRVAQGGDSGPDW